MQLETEPLTERCLNKAFFEERVEDEEDTTNASVHDKCCERVRTPISHAKDTTVSNVKFLGRIVVPYYWRYARDYLKIRPSKGWANRHIPGIVCFWRLCTVFKDYALCRRSTPPEEVPTTAIALREEPYPTKALVKSSWLNDLLIGLSMGAMSIPQGMSCAQLADLPVVLGLYNNMIFPIAYCLFGSSRHANSGTAAVENIMVGEAITRAFGEEGTAAQRENAGALLAWCMAIMYAIFRLFRLAVVAELLADPVLSGFSSAAALVVATSQFKHVVGMKAIGNSWSVFEIWYYIVSHITETHWPAFLTTVISIVFLKLTKEVTRRYISKRLASPGPFLLVIFGCLTSYFADLHGKFGIKIVGDIPPGLPSFMIPHVSWSAEHATLDQPNVWDFVLESLKITCLFFIIHIAVVKAIAHRNRYDIDNNQELVAFAGTNALGAVFGCYPACTSMSRTVVTESLGAQTHLHGFAAFAITCVTLAHLTVPLEYMPQSCLAAIIIYGVKKMFEWREFRQLYQLQKASWAAKGSGKGAHSPDCLLWVVAFVMTLAFDATIGILVAAGLSLLCLGKKLIRPDFVELGRLPGTDCFRNVERFGAFVEVYPTARVFRYDAPLNFANAKNLEHRVVAAAKKMYASFETQEVDEAAHAEAQQNEFGGAEQRKVLILDCSSIVQLDITAITCILRAHKEVQDLGMILVFSNWKGPQRDFLAQAEFYKTVPPEHCFLCTADALRWALTSASDMGTHVHLATLERAHAEGVEARV